MTEKYINKNGDVAVIFSPGYGGGYSDYGDYSVFDPDVVRCILNYKTDPHGSKVEYEKIMLDKYKTTYTPDFGQLEVEWLKPGTEFRIHEYDGYEGIELKEETSWYVA